MEEFDEIKRAVKAYETEDEKVAFLLKQLEIFIVSKDTYKKSALEKENVRTEKEITGLMWELTKGIKNIEQNRHKYLDPEVPNNMIEENRNRIHTLEWVLGEHDRFD